MPRRKRPDPRTMTGPELLRAAAQAGRSSDRNKAEGLRFAQFYYEQHGAEFLGQFAPGDFTVDDRGRVHMPGEYRLWSNGSMMLDMFADTTEKDGWDGPMIAAHLDEWIQAGIEPAAAVQEVVRELGARPDLSPTEVAERLRERADQVEREAAEADRS